MLNSPYSHFVASRQGLYAINESSWTRLAEGQYYGITLRDNILFAFEAGDRVDAPTQQGRIVAFQLTDNDISSSECLVEGLDNGCHQIDFIGNRLYVVDTYQQRIVEFSPCFQHFDYRYPLPRAEFNAWTKGYAHCNSLLGFGEHILLVLHDGGKHTKRPSRLVFCNQNWQIIRQLLLPGLGCHNIVILEDGTILSCGSLSGTLINAKRTIVKLDEMMTRGLSVDQDSIVVGASMFAIRRNRKEIPGRVHFLSRNYVRRATLELPAAPTDIRRIDGRDYSLSNYASSLPMTQSILA
jgi:hypothetical protein